MKTARQPPSFTQSELINRAAESFINGQANPALLCDVVVALLTQRFPDLAMTVESLHKERAKKIAITEYSFERGTFVKRESPICYKQVKKEADDAVAAIRYVVDHVSVLALVLQFLKMDTRATEQVAAQNAKEFLQFVERMFTLDSWTVPSVKEMLDKIAHKTNVPYDTIARIVMPLALHFQAKNFLAHYRKQITENFPRFEDLSQPFDLRAVRRGEILFADYHFDSYDATLIRSSVLSGEPLEGDDAWEIVAAAPPCSSAAVEKLLDNTAFNAKCKVAHLVVLANQFGGEGEMVNWFFAKPGTVMQFGSYAVIVKRVGYVATKEKLGAWMDLLPPLSEKVASEAARHVEFLLEVKKATGVTESVTVNFFKTPEGRFVDLWRPADFKKFYQLVMMQKTVAYCAADKESGGCAVFLSVLVKRFNHVFVKDDLSATIKNITALLKQLRAERPELTLAKERVMLLLRMSLQLTRYHLHIKNNLSTSSVLQTLKQWQGANSRVEEKPAESPRCKVVEEDKEAGAEKMQLQIIENYSQTTADKRKPSR